MPTYDYRCETNGQVVEVKHAMSEVLKTWGELCARAGVEPGETPVDSPVNRLITGGQFISSSGVGDAAPACATGACCPTGVCGLD
ncbi:MAG: zinc ribbon domain-containing protein [Gammaproteobacteria bacterium]|nr:zinc ribbon domain-containing protein [Gammaproteobacteria bacterium]